MSTKTLSDKTINSVMAVVLALGLATWFLGRAGITDGVDASGLFYLMVLLAYAKASVIIWYYVEIRWAPLWLKAACAIWVSLSFLTVVGTTAFLQ